MRALPAAITPQAKSPADPESIFWYDAPQYAPYLPQWNSRWEFMSYIDRQRKAGGAKKSN